MRAEMSPNMTIDQFWNEFALTIHRLMKKTLLKLALDEVLGCLVNRFLRFQIIMIYFQARSLIIDGLNTPRSAFMKANDYLEI